MRGLITAVLVIAFVPLVMAQQEDRLFTAEQFESNAFVQFEGYATDFLYETGMTTGFGLYWLVEHKYYLGARYTQLTTPADAGPIITALGEVDLDFRGAGIVPGYVFFHQKKFQFTPDVSLMWGQLLYQNPEAFVHRHNFFWVQPALKAIYSLHPNVRIGGHVAYRQSFGVNADNINDSHISGWSAGLFIRAGVF